MLKNIYSCQTTAVTIKTEARTKERCSVYLGKSETTVLILQKILYAFSGVAPDYIFKLCIEAQCAAEPVLSLCAEFLSSFVNFLYIFTCSSTKKDVCTAASHWNVLPRGLQLCQRAKVKMALSHSFIFFFFACWRVVEVARGDAVEEMEEAEQVALSSVYIFQAL